MTRFDGVSGDEPSALQLELDRLRDEFVAELPQRMDDIATGWQRVAEHATTESLSTLRLALHSLAGAAGTFSFQSLGESARRLEESIIAQGVEGRSPDASTCAALGERIAHLKRLAASCASRTGFVLPAQVRRRTRLRPLVDVVEDDHAQASRLRDALQGAGFDVRLIGSVGACHAALAEPGRMRPDAVVLDLVFPEGELAGLALLAAMRRRWDNCPPVLVLSVRDDLASRLAALRAGASRYLSKPAQPGDVCSVLETLTDRRPESPYRVLLVDDDPLLLAAQAAVLREAGMDVQVLQDPLQTLAVVDTFLPDVLLLDVYMPEVGGPEIAALLRERERNRELPILFLSAENDTTRQMLALNLGGDDFLVKPVLPEHLVAAVTARARRARQNAAQREQLRGLLYEREREHLALDQHAIVSIADARGEIVYANDRFCTISGYRREELFGQNHRLLNSGTHPREFFRDMWRTISSGNVWQGEICNRRKDGALYWVSSTITPFLDGSGKPYQYVSIRTDVTAIKEAEAEQRAVGEMSVLLAAAAADLLAATPDALDAAISRALRRAGEHLGADRAYLFLLCHDGVHLDNSTEWCAPGIPPQKEALQNLPISEFSWWWERMRRGEMIDVPDVSAMPVEAEPVKALLEGQGIRALCAFPLGKVGNPVGFVGFDQVTTTRQWDAPSLQLLGLLSGVIQSSLVRAAGERALEASKERLRRGQLYANIGTWEWNIITGALYWTERIAPLFGYPLSDLETSYDNFLAAVHPDDRQSVIDAVAACIERDVPYEIEHRAVWPDGTVRWLLERGAVQRDASGKPLQMIGVVQDIDDRKRAELALAERERQLLEAQRLASIGNWTANQISGELVWSDEIYRIFGHQPGSFSPTVEAFHAAVHPEDRDKVHASERESLVTGRHDVIHRILRPDGSVRHVHELAQMYLDADGRPQRLTGTVQDVTVRVEFEQALIAAREAADRANRAKSEFLSSMSHELRTPMNAILGFGQLMALDDTLPEEHRDNLDEILNAGHHLLALINEVLDLAKVESGRIDLSLEPVELASVVEECLTLVRPLAAKRSIRLDCRDLEFATVRADRIRLKQAILNLLSNAIKYNREHGHVRIEAVEQGGERVRIKVSDTGHGIPDSRLTELFQPFSRLDAGSSDIEGTGIGLTITRRIVELMGGSVDVESQLGVGSTFWIDLPRESAASTDAPAECFSSAGEALPSPYAAQQQVVLYIEDNPVNIRLVAQIFAQVPYIHLITAQTPSLGIALAQEHLPAVILLDIHMPESDGYQVLDVLKSDPHLQSTPVIAITANAMPRDVHRGLEAGFAGYLTKPLNIPELIGLVQRHLNRTGPLRHDHV